MASEEATKNTAAGAALARAAHLALDGEPKIFADHLAGALFGDGVDEVIELFQSAGSDEAVGGARSMVAGRSRYTESRLELAAKRGVAQYVILGAGLDSFVYRSQLGLTVFEVDLPAAQEWKREQVNRAGLETPSNLVYVPVDFESESVDEGLGRTDFAFDQPTFVSWVGTTPYLTTDAIEATLRAITNLDPGSELVVSYLAPQHLWTHADRAIAEFVMAAAEDRGEPVITFYEPDEFTNVLRSAGFESIRHYGPAEAAEEECFRERSDQLQPQGFERCASAVVSTRGK